MKIKTLSLENFRGISNLELGFSDQINVLVGANGAGKTAILDCLAIMLSRLVGRIQSANGTGRLFTENDISNKYSTLKSIIELKYKNDDIAWKVGKTRRGRKKQYITNLDGIKGVVESIQEELENDEKANIPIALFYSVNRAVLDIPLRIRTRHPFDQLSAYDRALFPDRENNFRIFFEWFREREDIENERRLKKRSYRDRQLGAVRRAVETFLPDVTDLRVKRQPLRMVVEKNKQELILNQLSDGEKCSLALVGDLARRMAIANPGLKDPLNGSGVVLVDEIDLHLHPSWQRHVIPSLTKTFPNCQFIFTTHSPQILSHVSADNIWILERSKGNVTTCRPEDSYGHESGRILEDIMGVPSRPQKIKDDLHKLYILIDEGKIEKAKRKLLKLQNTLGADPELGKISVLLLHKEITGPKKKAK